MRLNLEVVAALLANILIWGFIIKRVAVLYAGH